MMRIAVAQLSSGDRFDVARAKTRTSQSMLRSKNSLASAATGGGR